MKRIRLSQSAEADLDEIWAYYATQSANFEVADKQIESLELTFRLLGRNPSAGRARSDIEKGVRCLPSNSYLVYYKVMRSDLVILRVLHGMRNQNAAFSL
jgi:toxin ParE1/3/4